MAEANWKLWTFYVEPGMDKIDPNDNNSTTEWKTFLSLLLCASEKYMPLETISSHSKPFWNSESTKSSKELRHLRKNSNFAVFNEKQRSWGWWKQIGSFGHFMLNLAWTKSIRMTTTPLQGGKFF